jgi:predicted metal-dependent HD superfamily phosphohydrolase
MTILQKAENYIFELFKDKVSKDHLYHNFHHIFRVVEAVTEIGKGSNISEDQLEILQLAAWFHDAGYSISEELHEQKSAEIAEEFLKKENYPTEKIDQVKSLILATCAFSEPQNLLEEIMKDADTSHFASENYIGIAELLKLEWETTQNLSMSDVEWASTNRNLLLTCHRFYTDYAKENWTKGKESNIVALQKRIQKLQNPEESNKVKKKEPKEDKYSRAIDTMFRVTLNNHTRLSEIADSKANILLSVNAIIISIILGTLVPKLDSPSNMHLILPTLVLMISSLITVIFAILSTQPKVTEGTFTQEQVKNRQVNILFFGNFHKMPLSDYEWAMNDLMQDREELYNALTRDLYYLGLVLNRKYKLLRITYTLFTIGIILSMLAFFYAFLNLEIN